MPTDFGAIVLIATPEAQSLRSLSKISEALKKWISTNDWTDIHGAQTMNLQDVSEPLDISCSCSITFA